MTLLADWAIDVGHGEPHQRRQAAVAAGVPASVKTIVKAAARIMALSVRRKHPDGITPQAQPGDTADKHDNKRDDSDDRSKHPHDSGPSSPMVFITVLLTSQLVDGRSRLSYRGWQTLVFGHPCQTPGRQMAVPCGPASPSLVNRLASPARRVRRLRVAL